MYAKIAPLAVTNPTDFSLSRAGVHPGNLLFYLVFLPAAHFLSGKDLSVIAAIAWVAAVERRFVNLLSYPSLF